MGFYGSKVPDISPNIDKFAEQGIRFENAFTNNAICAPSRAIIGTGRYGHNSGAMGFMPINPKGSDNMIMAILKKQGYRTGVLGKIHHSTPDRMFDWDYVIDKPELGRGRNPSLYYQHTKTFIQQCKTEGKPFYLMVNSHDPHRPFFNPNSPNALSGGAKSPSRIYTPEEVEVPGFVPDLAKVREEICWYFNSTKRLDDTFGKTMQALEESGLAANTIVMFLSDNGIAIPFAKANTYFASNRTPWIIRWPDVIKPREVDKENFISEVDFMSTILDALQITPPKNLDGKSIIPLLKGKKQKNRDRIFAQIDSKISGAPVPMRSVQTKEFVYIFNPWADGKRVYGNNNEGLTWATMFEAAKTNPEIAKRCRLFRTKVMEELYDVQNDPNCLNNLVNYPDYKEAYNEMKQKLRNLMIESHDPVLELYENRYDADKLLKAFYKVYPDAKKGDRNKEYYSIKKYKRD